MFWSKIKKILLFWVVCYSTFVFLQYFINKFWSTRFSKDSLLLRSGKYWYWLRFSNFFFPFGTLRSTGALGQLCLSPALTAHVATVHCSSISASHRVPNEILKTTRVHFLSRYVKSCMLRYITGYIAIVVCPAGYQMFGSRMFGSKR